MAVSYNNMKKRMIDLDLKAKDLKTDAGISQNIMAKINKNEYISLESLEKICRVLKCDIGDVVSFVPDPSEKE